MNFGKIYKILLLFGYMDFRELMVWVVIGLLLIWFFNSSATLQISIGIIILALLLIRDSIEKKNKDTLIERASSETFYDATKWIAFGIFVAIYPSFLKTNLEALIITIFVFILVLFGLNILKQRNSPKR